MPAESAVRAAPHSTDAPRRWGEPLLSAAPMAALLLGFLTLKAYALSPVVGDENIYFYMAVRTAQGFIPYRDFFFGHPPLHLLPAVIVAALAGFHVAALKALTIGSAAAAGFFIWRLVRREAGPVEAAVAAALFLFSWDVLLSSTHYTAINEAVALAVAGLDAALARRDRAAGVLLGCAALTGFYTAPASVAIALLRLREDPRKAARLVLWAGGLFAAVNLAGLAVAGGSFLDQVYLHHLRKPGHPGEFWKLLKGAAAGNPWLAWSPVMAATALGVRRWLGRPEPPEGENDGASRRRLLLHAIAGVLVVIPFLSRLPQIAAYYFLLAFPFLAILGGVGYGAIFRLLTLAMKNWLSSDDSPDTAPAARKKRDTTPRKHGAPGRPGRQAATAARALAGAAILAAVATAGWAWNSGGSGRGTLETEEPDMEIATGPAWQNAPILPGWANSFVRAAFWADITESRRREGAVTGYLRHEARRFEALQPLVEEVRSRVPPEGTIFGDSISVPLIALLAGRRVALDDPDTQSVRFRSGGTPPAVMIARLEKAPPRLVIARAGWGFYIVPELRLWMETEYERVAVINDPWQGSFLVYERKGTS